MDRLRTPCFPFACVSDATLFEQSLIEYRDRELPVGTLLVRYLNAMHNAVKHCHTGSPFIHTVIRTKRLHMRGMT